MRRTLLLSAAFLVAASMPALALAPLTAHRAVYDLKLRDSKGANSVARVQGRIVYELTGSACEGWSLNFRQVTEITGGEESNTNLSDLRTASWEAGDGSSFRFTSQNLTNRALQKEVDGRANRGADGKIALTVSKPESFTTEFPASVLFPTQHLQRTIEAADRGQTTLEATVYDGSETGQKAYPTLTVMGRAIAAGAGANLEAQVQTEPFVSQRRWPVSVSYFDPAKEGSSESTPVYTIGFELYENGVSRALRIDYGDFTLDGALTDLKLLPQKPCN